MRPSGSLEPNRARRDGEGIVGSTGDTSGVVLDRLVPARRGRKPGPWCVLAADANGLTSPPSFEPSELVSDGDPAAAEVAAV